MEGERRNAQVRHAQALEQEPCPNSIVNIFRYLRDPKTLQSATAMLHLQSWHCTPGAAGRARDAGRRIGILQSPVDPGGRTEQNPGRGKQQLGKDRDDCDRRWLARGLPCGRGDSTAGLRGNAPLRGCRGPSALLAASPDPVSRSVRGHLRSFQPVNATHASRTLAYVSRTPLFGTRSSRGLQGPAAHCDKATDHD